MKAEVKKYQECLRTAPQRNLKLCHRGYCTAKSKYQVYPSAYANGYATQVCQGLKPDFKGQIKAEIPQYFTPYADNALRRWYQEGWVNVCKQGLGPGGYDLCGTGQGINDRANYPYCRPYYKLPGTKVKTVAEIPPQKLKSMCATKRSQPQGVNQRPTRVYLTQPSKGKMSSHTSRNSANFR